MVLCGNSDDAIFSFGFYLLISNNSVLYIWLTELKLLHWHISYPFTFLSLHQPSSSKFEVLLINFFHPLGIYAKCLFLVDISGAKAVEILEAYEGTLEDDYPPDNERCEHGEMLLYKVLLMYCFCSFDAYAFGYLTWVHYRHSKF